MPSNFNSNRGLSDSEPADCSALSTMTDGLEERRFVGTSMSCVCGKFILREPIWTLHVPGFTSRRRVPLRREGPASTAAPGMNVSGGSADSDGVVFFAERAG